jgi:hypothetical protein
MGAKNFPTGGAAAGILAVLLIIGLAELSSGVSPAIGTMLLIGVAVIVAGMILMFVMLSLQGSHRDSIAYQRVRDLIDGDKPKRGESLAELMSALSDGDLYDLRQHIKRRLIEQADAGDDDDFETFEALLADVEAKRKRG